MLARSIKRSQDDRGASAVVPVLLLLVCGIINFGILFGQNLALSNAARQAARFGAVEANDCAAVKAQAISAAAPLVSISASNANVSSPKVSSCSGTTKACAGSSAEDNVSVTLTYTAQVPVAGFIPGLGSTKVLTGKGVFRCEFK
jgi:Flp pilus assembly protein TadG